MTRSTFTLRSGLFREPITCWGHTVEISRSISINLLPEPVVPFCSFMPMQSELLVRFWLDLQCDLSLWVIGNHLWENRGVPPKPVFPVFHPLPILPLFLKWMPTSLWIHTIHLTKLWVRCQNIVKNWNMKGDKFLPNRTEGCCTLLRLQLRTSQKLTETHLNHYSNFHQFSSSISKLI